jgi:Transcriptional regulator
MDRRIKKTKAAIYAAFTELLSKKKYSQITIQEIIDLADIGRSTFYSHFETKDELLKSMCLDMFQDMGPLKHSFDTANPHSVITDILYHIRENKKAIKGVFTSESGDLFMNYFKAYFNRQIEELLDYSNKSFQIAPKDFLINPISGSFIEMVKWWAENNMKQTPEELTAYYLSVIAPFILP